MAAPIADLIVEHTDLDDEAVAAAQRRADETGTSVTKVLLDDGSMSARQLRRVHAAHLQVPWVVVRTGDVDLDLFDDAGPETLSRLQAVPTRVDRGPAGRRAIVAVGDLHARQQVKDDLEGAYGIPVAVVAADPDEVAAALESAAAAAARRAAAGTSRASSVNRRAGLVDLGDAPYAIDEALAALVDLGGSDIHLTVGVPPMIRRNGEMMPLDRFPRHDKPGIERLLTGMLSDAQREQFERDGELDTSYSVDGLARFRVNIFKQRNSMAAVMRVIPYEILPLEALGVPPVVAGFTDKPRGLVLVTGPTGSGKSTTLASMIDLINRNHAAHILTVEDPIEFTHQHKRSVVNQREVGQDTGSFAEALKRALRQDPDVILVGEMRDLETISIALTAAETGHLVFGTLHTQSADKTIDRIIDVFPPSQQEQIRIMLAGSLQGVVAQQLLKKADGSGRVVATEVLVATPAIRNLVREGKTHQIPSSLQSGGTEGMVTMDTSLARLVRSQQITFEQAADKCSDLNELKRLCGRG